MNITDWEKCQLRGWSVNSTLELYKNNKAKNSLNQLLKDAEKVNNFIIQKPPVDIKKLNEKI